MNEEYELMDEDEEPVIALPPVLPRQWSWNTQTLLYVAGGVTAVGFIAWFLMTYTSAKSKAIAAATGGDDE